MHEYSFILQGLTHNMLHGYHSFFLLLTDITTITMTSATARPTAMMTIIARAALAPGLTVPSSVVL